MKTVWGKDDEPVSDNEDIIVINNNIYFYSDICNLSILKLNKEIKTLENNYLFESISRGQDFITPINLYIFSYGGDIRSSLSGMDTILNCKVPIHTIVDGCCGSAATLLSIVGKRRFIKENSYMLIHQLTSLMLGKYSEQKDQMKNNDQTMQAIKNIYKKYTKIPPKKLNEILNHDLWWDSKTCLKYGMVDTII